jgi:hypothetical protein
LKKDRPVSRITDFIRLEFVRAFEESDQPRYRVVNSPTADSVTLQLALIELNPSSVTGNVVRKGASVVLTPAATLGSVFTNGRIALEGRLIDSTEKWSLFEFGDREKDNIAFWTLRDFKPYGHSKVAIREWAHQFEEATRNGVRWATPASGRSHPGETKTKSRSKRSRRKRRAAAGGGKKRSTSVSTGRVECHTMPDIEVSS